MARTAVQIRKGAAKLVDLNQEFGDPALGTDTCERLHVNGHPSIVARLSGLVERAKPLYPKAMSAHAIVITSGLTRRGSPGAVPFDVSHGQTRSSAAQ
jgi:hypothetical protein